MNATRTVLTVAVMLAPATLAPADPADSTRKMLDAAGVTGGLIVHLGCGEGQRTAALHAGEGYLVHGLDTDAAKVAKAREHLRTLGLYGAVSVDPWDGRRLPYADNLVALLVADELGTLPMAEVLRVLRPKGVALIGGTKTVKPWPADIDEWTHHLHDAGGNAVAADRVVGPPRRLQWTAEPLWARSHGYTPSVTAMVSAGGRLFCIVDESLTGIDDTVPSQWRVVARDAFSGVLLWKRPMRKWGSGALSGTSGVGRGVTTGRFTMPPHAGKRLVAVGDRVYVTLGAGEPVTALDAATGKTRRTYNGTGRADEIVCTDGRLVVTIDPPAEARPAVTGTKDSPAPPPGKHVCAVDVGTGKVLWKTGPFVGIRSGRGQDPFGRLELVAGDGKVFVLTREAVQCMDLQTGKRLWRAQRPPLPASAVRRLGFAGMYEYLLTVMVYRDGVVLLAQPEPNTHHTYHTMPGTLFAFDAADGRPLWKHGYGGWGHCTQPDVFVVGDAVWTHVHAQTEHGSVWGSGLRAKDTSKVDYRIQALDLRSGRPRKELGTKTLFNVGHHHRCFRNKITERYLFASRRGVELVDLATGENFQNHWVRSGCKVGSLPCNGLIYVAPHPCGCYLNAKLIGFNALAPAPARAAEGEPFTPRLEKGPAFSSLRNPQTAIRNSEDWPTYRHDARRSGATEAAVGTKLSVAWQADAGTKLSGLTVAGGKVFVADVDAHTVCALDAENGKEAWHYTAGGRVDSPPTIHNGRAIFGSADGSVYCLRASDGAPAWRFDAAGSPRRVVAFNRLESPWPVPGSVLVREGRCWFAAGRCSYMDDGIRLYALDPGTGKVTHRETICHLDPNTGKMPPEPNGHQMVGLLNDVPGTDEKGNVFIRQQNVSSSGSAVRMHLFTTGGYLDPSWFNRTYWKVGRAQSSGLMVLGKDVAYGVELYPSRSRETVFQPAAGKYRLVCYSLKPPARSPSDKKAKARRQRQGPTPTWEQRVPVRITAMLRAAGTIFVAGCPDVVDPADPHGAWEGRKGGVLAAFRAADGKKLVERTLPAPPVWDGLSAAGGKLYVALTNGQVLCLAGP